MPSLSLVAARFLEHFPQLRELRIVRAWAAVTTYTEDDLPVFGKSERAENFFTVAGFKGAFSVAPAIGRITCEALSGKSQPEYEIFTPDRA
jgi:sarcosine oxidase subunit beta